MKKTIIQISIIASITALFFVSCKHRCSIEQEVEVCGDATHFRVRTWVWENKVWFDRKILTSFDTWDENNLQCFEICQMDSLKKVEQEKAEMFIHKYDSVQKIICH
jgi:hypothetical protein